MLEVKDSRGSQNPGHVARNAIRRRTCDDQGMLVIPVAGISEFNHVETEPRQKIAEGFSHSGFPASVQDLNLSGVGNKRGWRCGFLFATGEREQQGECDGKKSKLAQLRKPVPERLGKRRTVGFPGIRTVEEFDIHREIFSGTVFQSHSRKNQRGTRAL